MVTSVTRVVAGAALSAFAAVGPGAGPALAGPAFADNVRCDPVCHGTWCPGDPITFRVQTLSATWDPNVCHEYHQVAGQPGVYAEGQLPPGTFVCAPFSFMCP